MTQPDAATESGVYYIVPNRNGKGKRVIRKPRPPPTSAPLPDDFDAVTQECATMKGPDTERGHPSRYSWVPTSPLSNAGNRSRGSLPASHSRPGDSSVRISEREHGLDITCAAGLDDYGEYSRYLDEIEHMFGRRKPVEVSVRTLESQRLSATRKCHGQCSTREYEVVKDRVLEDSSDKTVTISTWREKVAEETSREVEMSVYYINAEDYLDPISEEGGQQTRSPKQRVRDGRQTPWPREVSASPMRKKTSRPSSSMTGVTTRNAVSNGTSNGGNEERARPVSPSHSMTRDWWNTPFRTSTPVKRRSSAGTTNSFSLSALGRTPSVERSTMASSLRSILSSCEPSLVHITPVLHRLGIRSVDHLRALARLNEETRDREVRNVALKGGVTVVEWAILLDKLLSL